MNIHLTDDEFDWICILLQDNPGDISTPLLQNLYEQALVRR